MFIWKKKKGEKVPSRHFSAQMNCSSDLSYIFSNCLL